MNNLPDSFSKRMEALMGDEFPEFAHSCSSGDRKNALRITELKTIPAKLVEQAPFKMEPVRWLQNGFFYDFRDEVSVHPYYRAGLYYITEASAMTPADRFPIEPGNKVLDLCAAPGGKACALAGKLKGRGLLFANEVNPARAKALLYNLETLGASNIIITSEQPHKMAEHFKDFFDRILVDAPCSGEGMFRRNPEAAKQWSEDKVLTLSALQKSILSSAVRMLKPGGLLMYSTCTFSPEENEQNVSWLLNEYADMHITEIEPYEGFDRGRPEWAGGDGRVSQAVRIWPHKMEGEGQFMALFRKDLKTDDGENAGRTVPADEKAGSRSSGAGKSGRHQKDRSRKDRPRSDIGKNRGLTREEKRIFDEFAAHMELDMEGRSIESCGGSLYLVCDEIPDTAGLRTVRRGLYLGEIRKERFTPSQSLAYALSAETFDNVYELKNDPDGYERYMRGETIIDQSGEETAENGWILITYDGFSLGFGKKNGGLIKNKLLYSRRTE